MRCYGSKDYSAIEGAELIINTAGVPRKAKPDGTFPTREELLTINLKVTKSVADGIKLMTKQLLIPGGVDKAIFMVAPVLAMFPALISFVTIPFSENIVAHPIDVGLLMIFAFAALGSMSLLIAGWSSRNKYSMISSVRAVSQTVAYEIPLLITTTASGWGCCRRHSRRWRRRSSTKLSRAASKLRGVTPPNTPWTVTVGRARSKKWLSCTRRPWRIRTGWSS